MVAAVFGLRRKKLMNNIKTLTEKFLGNAGTNNEKNRVKWIKSTLKKIPRNSSILDAGAGELQFKRFCKHLKYTSQDFAQYDGRGNNKGLQTKSWDNSKLDIISDIIAIPRPDKSFDTLMCIEVFEHLPDPISALKEFERLLKPGGYLIITAPFTSLTHFAPFHFCTGFSSYFYIENLQRLNFEILELLPNGNYFEYIAQEVRRIPSISLDYLKKQPSFLEKIGLAIVINMLSRFAIKGKNTSDLACLGYHVLARKK